MSVSDKYWAYFHNNVFSGEGELKNGLPYSREKFWEIMTTRNTYLVGSAVLKGLGVLWVEDQTRRNLSPNRQQFIERVKHDWDIRVCPVENPSFMTRVAVMHALEQASGKSDRVIKRDHLNAFWVSEGGKRAIISFGTHSEIDLSYVQKGLRNYLFSVKSLMIRVEDHKLYTASGEQISQVAWDILDGNLRAPDWKGLDCNAYGRLVIMMSRDFSPRENDPRSRMPKEIKRIKESIWKTAGSSSHGLVMAFIATTLTGEKSIKPFIEGKFIKPICREHEIMLSPSLTFRQKCAVLRLIAEGVDEELSHQKGRWRGKRRAFRKTCVWYQFLEGKPFQGVHLFLTISEAVSAVKNLPAWKELALPYLEKTQLKAWLQWYAKEPDAVMKRLGEYKGKLLATNNLLKTPLNRLLKLKLCLNQPGLMNDRSIGSLIEQGEYTAEEEELMGRLLATRSLDLALEFFHRAKNFSHRQVEDRSLTNSDHPYLLSYLEARKERGFGPVSLDLLQRAKVQNKALWEGLQKTDAYWSAFQKNFRPVKENVLQAVEARANLHPRYFRAIHTLNVPVPSDYLLSQSKSFDDLTLCLSRIACFSEKFVAELSQKFAKGGSEAKGRLWKFMDTNLEKTLLWENLWLKRSVKKMPMDTRRRLLLSDSVCSVREVVCRNMLKKVCQLPEGDLFRVWQTAKALPKVKKDLEPGFWINFLLKWHAKDAERDIRELFLRWETPSAAAVFWMSKRKDLSPEEVRKIFRSSYFVPKKEVHAFISRHWEEYSSIDGAILKLLARADIDVSIRHYFTKPTYLKLFLDMLESEVSTANYIAFKNYLKLRVEAVKSGNGSTNALKVEWRLLRTRALSTLNFSIVMQGMCGEIINLHEHLSIRDALLKDLVRDIPRDEQSYYSFVTRLKGLFQVIKRTDFVCMLDFLFFGCERVEYSEKLAKAAFHFIGDVTAQAKAGMRPILFHFVQYFPFDQSQEPWLGETLEALVKDSHNLEKEKRFQQLVFNFAMVGSLLHSVQNRDEQMKYVRAILGRPLGPWMFDFALQAPAGLRGAIRPTMNRLLIQYFGESERHSKIYEEAVIAMGRLLSLELIRKEGYPEVLQAALDATVIRLKCCKPQWWISVCDRALITLLRNPLVISATAKGRHACNAHLGEFISAVEKVMSLQCERDLLRRALYQAKAEVQWDWISQSSECLREVDLGSIRMKNDEVFFKKIDLWQEEVIKAISVEEFRKDEIDYHRTVLTRFAMFFVSDNLMFRKVDNPRDQIFVRFNKLVEELLECCPKNKIKIQKFAVELKKDLKKGYPDEKKQESTKKLKRKQRRR